MLIEEFWHWGGNSPYAWSTSDVGASAVSNACYMDGHVKVQNVPYISSIGAPSYDMQLVLQWYRMEP